MALKEMTGEYFGEDSVKWQEWWEENKKKLPATLQGETKDPHTVEPLIDALKDEDPFVQVMAALALGAIKDPRAVEPLIANLRDKDSAVRGVAALVLGEIKDPSAVEPLIAALKDADSSVRGGAVAALKEITGQDFGEDSVKWQEWWEENKEKFRK